MTARGPRVALGLPVRNGEKFIAEAIESVLAQTFHDFELVVRDNASTDRTVEICRSYAVRDTRVRVYHSERDGGPAENFNRVFAHTTGTYFKWIAHDDRIAPEYLARCVEILDRNPGVVLVQTGTEVVDEGGGVVERPEEGIEAASEQPARRFEETLRGGRCFEVFGLIRRSALAQTRLIGRFAHGDGVLLAWLALLGRFHHISERLHQFRRHDRQSMALLSDSHWAYVRYAYWFNPAREGRLVFPFWRMGVEYVRTVVSTRLSARDRLRCAQHVAAWGWRCRRRLRGEITFALRRAFGRDPLANTGR